MDKSELVRSMTLFEGLGEDRLDRLAAGAELRVYEPRNLIFQQGDAPEYFHVLLDGMIKLYKGTAEGKEHTLYIVEVGEPFCICTIYDIAGLPLTAEAMTKCQVCSFPALEMKSLAMETPELLCNILRVFNNRLLSSMRMIEDLALRGIYQRVASFLMHSARVKGGEEAHVSLRVPRQEVAKILGTTPETISRVLARMTDEGLITAQGRRIEILEPEALEEIAG
jgi:CRP/FNR family transcriptional regulator